MKRKVSNLQEKKTPIDGVLVVRHTVPSIPQLELKSEKPKKINPELPIQILDPAEAIQELGLLQHKLNFVSTFTIAKNLLNLLDSLMDNIQKALLQWVESNVTFERREKYTLRARSVSLSLQSEKLIVKWSFEDEDLAIRVLSIINRYKFIEIRV